MLPHKPLTPEVLFNGYNILIKESSPYTAVAMPVKSADLLFTNCPRGQIAIWHLIYSYITTLTPTTFGSIG